MLRIKMLAVLCLALVAITFASGCAPLFTCIAEGTLVRTPDGMVPIESLKVGSRVVTGDSSGKTAEGTVIAVLESKTSIIQRTVLDNGSELRTTPEHPIATPRGFQQAGALTVGDEVVVLGGTARVVGIYREKKRSRVFDLSVEPGNTFFASGVLVHNKTMMRPPNRRDLIGKWVGLGLFKDRADVRYWLDVTDDGTCTLRDHSGALWQGFTRVEREFTWDRIDLELQPMSRSGSSIMLRFVPPWDTFRAQMRTTPEGDWNDYLFIKKELAKSMTDSEIHSAYRRARSR